jgi:hypothetical protein
LLNFILTCVVILIVWLIVKTLVKRSDPPVNGFGWVVDLVALVFVLLALVMLLQNKCAIALGCG